MLRACAHWVLFCAFYTCKCDAETALVAMGARCRYRHVTSPAAMTPALKRRVAKVGHVERKAPDVLLSKLVTVSETHSD